MKASPVSIDRWLQATLRVAATMTGAIVVAISWFVWREAWPAISEVGVGRLVTDPSWHPTAGRFNMLPMAVGSVVLVAGTALITFPLGLGSAIFLRSYAPKALASRYRGAIQILAGVPSVVFGLWGLEAVVPRIARSSPTSQGESLLAGIVVLSMMTLPTFALVADSAIGSVSPHLVRAGQALGLGRRAVLTRIVLPAARGGILTGGLLQIARALGETMAVLMVCGNVARLPGSLFDSVRVLTANIALEMGYASDDHRSVLFVSGLFLMLLVLTLVSLAEWFDGEEVRSA